MQRDALGWAGLLLVGRPAAVECCVLIVALLTHTLDIAG